MIELQLWALLILIIIGIITILVRIKDLESQYDHKLKHIDVKLTRLQWSFYAAQDRIKFIEDNLDFRDYSGAPNGKTLTYKQRGNQIDTLITNVAELQDKFKAIKHHLGPHPRVNPKLFDAPIEQIQPIGSQLSTLFHYHDLLLNHLGLKVQKGGQTPDKLVKKHTKL